MSRNGPARPGVDRLRPLNLPSAVAVRTDEHGEPLEVTPAGDRCFTVEAVVEVWKIADEWWREEISRRCVEVVLEGGRHVVLFEDLTTGNWYLQRP